MRKLILTLAFTFMFGGCTAIKQDIKTTSLEDIKTSGELIYCVLNRESLLCREIIVQDGNSSRAINKPYKLDGNYTVVDIEEVSLTEKILYLKD